MARSCRNAGFPSGPARAGFVACPEQLSQAKLSNGPSPTLVTLRSSCRGARARPPREPTAVISGLSSYELSPEIAAGFVLHREWGEPRRIRSPDRGAQSRKKNRWLQLFLLCRCSRPVFVLSLSSVVERNPMPDGRLSNYSLRQRSRRWHPGCECRVS